jgi:hypothetical protein
MTFTLEKSFSLKARQPNIDTDYHCLNVDSISRDSITVLLKIETVVSASSATLVSVTNLGNPGMDNNDRHVTRAILRRSSL